MQPFQVEVPTPEYWQRQINCQEACPVHTDARGYVRAVAEGKFEEAYLIARGPNPLASICGRVCGAPCEAACRRGELDQSVSIRALKRFVSDKYGTSAAKTPVKNLIQRLIDSASSRDCSRKEELFGFNKFLDQLNASDNKAGEKVAIIGSGPAGLAAAHDLALLGFRPTVYEMEAVPAGMLAVGIPAYRLPRDLIAAEVEFIRALGVEFICNTQVGKDISFEEIRKNHSATIIAIGLKKSRSLPLPGAEGTGVLGGVEFLRNVAVGDETQIKGNVVVIGGGNVAYDIARTVIRQTGVDISRTALRGKDVGTVHLCSLESLEELPADDLEIIEGDEEGVQRHHGIGPKEIQRDENGNITAVVFQRCEHVFDEQGRFAPKFNESVLTTIPADAVIWSVGQQPDLSFLDPAGSVKLNERGLIDADAEALTTTADDVFVAGDIAYGPRLLIDAVACGKKVARKVYERLRGEKLQQDVELVHLDIPNYSREQDYEKLERTEIPALSPEERSSSQSTIVELGYDEQQAVREGSRCLDCGVNTIFDSEICILCGGCADVCPELCLELVSLDRLQGDDLVQQVLSDGAEPEELSNMSAIIKDETICIRCALCAERCPTGAITMERVSFSSCWSSVETQ